jgi:hypothetical protein
MKNKKLFSMLAALVFVASSPIFAADVKVIANPSVSATSVSSGDIQSVFLLDKDSLGGSHVRAGSGQGRRGTRGVPERVSGKERLGAAGFLPQSCLYRKGLDAQVRC